MSRKTSAASTAFCTARIDVGLDHLWIDGNAKITAGNGSFAHPSPNAFSLVQIADCPRSTETCRASCYVHGLEKHAQATHDLYKHNSATIRRILARPASVRAQWARSFAQWITRHASGGFRWHVSGDVFSADYAEFIRDVCQRAPDVRFWIYTRSFEYVGILVRAANLAVNLSADKDNYQAAERCRSLHPRDVRICYLSDNGDVPATLIDGDVVFPDYSLRGDDGWRAKLPTQKQRMLCPVDFFGKSNSIRCGVCTKCLEPGSRP